MQHAASACWQYKLSSLSGTLVFFNRCCGPTVRTNLQLNLCWSGRTRTCDPQNQNLLFFQLNYASIKHQPSCLAGESITPFCSSESNPYTIYYRELRYPLSVKSFLFLLFLFVINSLIFFLHTAFTFSINNCMSAIMCQIKRCFMLQCRQQTQIVRLMYVWTHSDLNRDSRGLWDRWFNHLIYRSND